MSSQHKRNPVNFRPPEADRAWLYAYAEATGRTVGAVLSEALTEYRAAHSRAPGAAHAPHASELIVSHCPPSAG